MGYNGIQWDLMGFNGIQWDSMGFNGINDGIAAGKLTVCYWKWWFIVDLPIN